jgi:hypothetical protein
MQIVSGNKRLLSFKPLFSTVIFIIIVDSNVSSAHSASTIMGSKPRLIFDIQFTSIAFDLLKPSTPGINSNR